MGDKRPTHRPCSRWLIKHHCTTAPLAAHILHSTLDVLPHYMSWPILTITTYNSPWLSVISSEQSSPPVNKTSNWKEPTYNTHTPPLHLLVESLHISVQQPTERQIASSIFPTQSDRSDCHDDQYQTNWKDTIQRHWRNWKEGEGKKKRQKNIVPLTWMKQTPTNCVPDWHWRPAVPRECSEADQTEPQSLYKETAHPPRRSSNYQEQDGKDWKDSHTLHNVQTCSKAWRSSHRSTNSGVAGTKKMGTLAVTTLAKRVGKSPKDKDKHLEDSNKPREKLEKT